MVMECYLRSEQNRGGFYGLFEVSEQQLVGQARCIKNSGWLSEVEIEEVRRKIKERGNENEENSQGPDDVIETRFEVDEQEVMDMGNRSRESTARDYRCRTVQPSRRK